MWYVVHPESSTVLRAMWPPSESKTNALIGIDTIVESMPELRGKLEALQLTLAEVAELDAASEALEAK